MTYPQQAFPSRRSPLCPAGRGRVHEGLHAVLGENPAVSYAVSSGGLAHPHGRFNRIGQFLRRALCCGLACWMLWCIAPLNPAEADDFSSDTRFFKQLTAPMTSVLDGKSFRSGLERIATQTGLNLWLDRQVDPSVLIKIGPLGPTVFASLEKLAGARDCAVMPVAGVVLVGRKLWVERTAAKILAIAANNRGPLVNVSWDDLTTPQEALDSLTGGAASTGAGPARTTLPHDLWPAVRWQGIDRQVASALILAQFDTLPGDRESELEPPTVFTRRYSKGVLALPKFREVMQSVDPSIQTRVSGDWIVAKGTVAAHRAVTIAMIEQAGDAAGSDPDTDTFALEKMTTTAENAFQQLAQAARKTCIIKAEAVEACKTMISIEGTDVTIRQLIDMAAKQAGVRASWNDDSIVITSAP